MSLVVEVAAASNTEVEGSCDSSTSFFSIQMHHCVQHYHLLP